MWQLRSASGKDWRGLVIWIFLYLIRGVLCHSRIVVLVAWWMKQRKITQRAISASSDSTPNCWTNLWKAFCLSVHSLLKLIQLGKQHRVWWKLSQEVMRYTHRSWAGFNATFSLTFDYRIVSLPYIVTKHEHHEIDWLKWSYFTSLRQHYNVKEASSLVPCQHTL